MLTVTAAAQAEDGMPLKNFRSYTFADPAGAPGEERLAGDIDGMVQELMALRSAPVIDEYSGPVLFEKQAAAEVLARGFVRMLAVRRLPETDLSQFEGIFEKADNPLLKKVDAKVMGEAISVKAVPSRSACGGTPLLGSYAVDDEGVRPRELYLVEKGLLKGFLTSRSPVKGFGQSNGHCRGSGPQPSVIEISSAKAAGRGELKERLIAKLQEEGLTYGFIVETILPPTLVSDDLGGFISVTGGSRVSGEFSVSKPVMVRRVHADGREELVRGVCLAPMNVKVFKSIIGVTDEAFVYNYPLDSSGSPYEPGASWRDALSRSYSTVLAPSLLLPEVDLTKPSGDYRKPPIVSYPPAAK